MKEEASIGPDIKPNQPNLGNFIKNPFLSLNIYHNYTDEKPSELEI